MDCPQCAVELEAIVHEESIVNRCAECSGIWVDGTDLNKILLHNNLQALASIGGSINVDELTGMCPACNVDLVVIEGGGSLGLSYDTCESCGGLWIEGPEREGSEASATWEAVTADLASFFRAFAKKK